MATAESLPKRERTGKESTRLSKTILPEPVHNHKSKMSVLIGMFIGKVTGGIDLARKSAKLWPLERKIIDWDRAVRTGERKDAGGWPPGIHRPAANRHLNRDVSTLIGSAG
jgi:hypothetical protein